MELKWENVAVIDKTEGEYAGEMTERKISAGISGETLFLVFGYDRAHSELLGWTDALSWDFSWCGGAFFSAEEADIYGESAGLGPLTEEVKSVALAELKKLIAKRTGGGG